MTPNVFCKRLVGWLDLFNAEKSPETEMLAGAEISGIGEVGVGGGWGGVGMGWGGVGE